MTRSRGAHDIRTDPPIRPREVPPLKLRKYAGFLLAFLALIVLIVSAVGALLPASHRAARSAEFAAPPADVYAAIVDVEEFPKWRTGVERVDVGVAPRDSFDFREIYDDMTITYIVDERVPNRRVVNRIADETLPFGGRWIFELQPSGSGTRLQITEEGEVGNVIFRFMSRFVFGHTSNLEQYLEDLRNFLPAGGQ